MSDSVLPPHDSLGAQGANPDSGRPGSTPTYETYDPENMVAEGYVPFQAPPAEFHTNFPGYFTNGVNTLTPDGGANATWPPQQTPQWWPSAPSSAPMHTPVHPGLAHGPMSFQQAINSTTPTHEHTAMPGAHQLPPTHWPGQSPQQHAIHTIAQNSIMHTLAAQQRQLETLIQENEALRQSMHNINNTLQSRRHRAHTSASGTLLEADEDEHDEHDEDFRIVPFSTSTIKGMRTKLDTVAGIPAFIRIFRQRCSSHHPAIAAVLGLANESDIATGDTKQHVANRWLATTLIDCLDQSSANVLNLIANATDAQLGSGLAMLQLVDKEQRFSIGAARLQAENEFRKDRPFRAGMNAAEAELAARHTITAFKRLGEYNSNDPLCVRLMLIKKMPTEPKQLDDKRRKLQEELFDADIAANSAEERHSKPWNEEQLIKIIALCLGTAHSPAARAAAVDPTPTPTTDPDSACPSCGKRGHTSRECRSKCSECKLKNCPGTYGGSCIMRSAEKPRRVLNARGRPVANVIYEHLTKEHKKRHPRAHAAEADDVHAANDASDDAHGTTNAASAAISATVAAAAVASDVSGPSLHASVANVHDAFKTPDAAHATATPSMSAPAPPRAHADPQRTVPLSSVSHVPRRSLTPIFDETAPDPPLVQYDPLPEGAIGYCKCPWVCRIPIWPGDPFGLCDFCFCTHGTEEHPGGLFGEPCDCGDGCCAPCADGAPDGEAEGEDEGAADGADDGADGGADDAPVDGEHAREGASDAAPAAAPAHHRSPFWGIFASAAASADADASGLTACAAEAPLALGTTDHAAAPWRTIRNQQRRANRAAARSAQRQPRTRTAVGSSMGSEAVASSRGGVTATLFTRRFHA